MALELNVNFYHHAIAAQSMMRQTSKPIPSVLTHHVCRLPVPHIQRKGETQQEVNTDAAAPQLLSVGGRAHGWGVLRLGLRLVLLFGRNHG